MRKRKKIKQMVLVVPSKCCLSRGRKSEKNYGDVPSIGKEHMVRRVELDRFGVKLDRLVIVLGGKRLVTKTKHKAGEDWIGFRHCVAQHIQMQKVCVSMRRRKRIHTKTKNQGQEKEGSYQRT